MEIDMRQFDIDSVRLYEVFQFLCVILVSLMRYDNDVTACTRALLWVVWRAEKN